MIHNQKYSGTQKERCILQRLKAEPVSSLVAIKLADSLLLLLPTAQPVKIPVISHRRLFTLGRAEIVLGCNWLSDRVNRECDYEGEIFDRTAEGIQQRLMSVNSSVSIINFLTHCWMEKSTSKNIKLPFCHIFITVQLIEIIRYGRAKLGVYFHNTVSTGAKTHMVVCWCVLTCRNVCVCVKHHCGR